MCASLSVGYTYKRVMLIPRYFTLAARNFAVLSWPPDCIARIFIAAQGRAALGYADMHIRARQASMLFIGSHRVD